MAASQKQKKRGFVMTGGGAKGLYEAGVIHAFHISGMEFDVITGSSVGAMNSIFFAEYLYQKRRLPAEIQQDPAKAIEALDDRVKAFHHAWLQLPARKLIDDSEQGPLGQLKNDLEQLTLEFPLLVQLGWWWTDPSRQSMLPPSTWPGLFRLSSQAVKHLGGMNEVLRILKFNQTGMFQEAARTYLRRFDLERALVPPDQDHKIHDFFSDPVSPLKLENLLDGDGATNGSGPGMVTLVDPDRTLRDYAQEDITVRLTRANYRTGRLEMSAYIPMERFVRFMHKQAWRLQASDPDKIPLGSFRLQVPGNPNAINAAVCSGRFPGVFAPFPIESIYPRADPENAMLYRLLEDWLASPEIQAEMQQAYNHIHSIAGGDSGDIAGGDAGGKAGSEAGDKPVEDSWNSLYNSWNGSQSMRNFFPRAGDIFVDGGTIDNTPSNSAVDYAKEWVEEKGASKRDVALELFIIFLSVEPESRPIKVQDPASFEVVGRTLEIQGAANRSADANTLNTINSFGQRSEDLALVLNTVLGNFQDTCANLTPDQQTRLQQNLFDQARNLGVSGFIGDQPEGILERMQQWLEKVMKNALPVQVNPVKIYPEEMPLDTLQFTERMGYRKDNAILMLTMGCQDTLWTLRNRLETQPEEALDKIDHQSLALTRQWMGVDDWPTKPADQEKLRSTWQCRRTACVFHPRHCAHGAKISRS